MAGAINIASQIYIRDVVGVREAFNKIQSQLGSLSVSVDVRISSASLRTLDDLNARMTTLLANLQAVQAATFSATQGQGSIASGARAASEAVSGVGAAARAMNSTVRAAANELGSTASGARVASNALSRIGESARSVRNVSNDLRVGADTAERFGTSVGLAVRRIAAFSVAGGAIIATLSGIKNGIASALEFEQAMLRIAAVSGQTPAQLSRLKDSITSISTSLGVSSQELAGASSSLVQLGLSAEKTAVALQAIGRASLLPGFENIKQTTDGAVSILQQFDAEVNNLEGHLGSLAAVSSHFAVGTNEMLDLVRRSGAVFRQTGGELNELIGLFASVRSTTRESAESISSGFRTIFSRLESAPVIESLKNLQINLRYTRQEAQALGDLHLQNQFVGQFEAIRRISEGLSRVRETDPRYQAVLSSIGGNRNVSRVLPLLNEFGEAERARNLAAAGQQSVSLASERVQDGILQKTKKVKEEYQALFRTITESKGFRATAESLLYVASAFAKVLDFAKPLLPLLTTMATLKVFEGVGRFATNFVTGSNSGFLSYATTYASQGRSPAQQQSRPGYARGGPVPGHGYTDSVHANLMPGEFVIKRDSARQIGYAALDHANKTGRMPAFAFGDTVTRAAQPLPLLAGGQHLTQDELFSLLEAHAGPGFTTRRLLAEGLRGSEVTRLIPKGSQFLGHGIAAMAFRAPAGHVVRVQPYVGLRPFQKENALGFRPTNHSPSIFNIERPRIEPVLQSLASTMLPATAGRIFAEHLPFAPSIADQFKSGRTSTGHAMELADFDGNLARDIKGRVKKAGYIYPDLHTGNVGFENGVLKILDPGSLQTRKAYAKRMLGYVPHGLSEAIGDETTGFALGGSTSVSTVDGFAVRRFEKGGAAGADRIPALLTPGEFVFGRDAVQAIGLARLHRMNTMGKTHGYSRGGEVSEAGPIRRANGSNEGEQGGEDWTRRLRDLLKYKYGWSAGQVRKKDVSELERILNEHLTEQRDGPDDIYDERNKVSYTPIKSPLGSSKSHKKIRAEIKETEKEFRQRGATSVEPAQIAKLPVEVGNQPKLSLPTIPHQVAKPETTVLVPHSGKVDIQEARRATPPPEPAKVVLPDPAVKVEKIGYNKIQEGGFFGPLLEQVKKAASPENQNVQLVAKGDKITEVFYRLEQAAGKVILTFEKFGDNAIKRAAPIQAAPFVEKQVSGNALNLRPSPLDEEFTKRERALLEKSQFSPIISEVLANARGGNAFKLIEGIDTKEGIKGFDVAERLLHRGIKQGLSGFDIEKLNLKPDLTPEERKHEINKGFLAYFSKAVYGKLNEKTGDVIDQQKAGLLSTTARGAGIAEGGVQKIDTVSSRSVDSPVSESQVNEMLAVLKAAGHTIESARQNPVEVAKLFQRRGFAVHEGFFNHQQEKEIEQAIRREADANQPPLKVPEGAAPPKPPRKPPKTKKGHPDPSEEGNEDFSKFPYEPLGSLSEEEKARELALHATRRSFFAQGAKETAAQTKKEGLNTAAFYQSWDKLSPEQKEQFLLNNPNVSRTLEEHERVQERRGFREGHLLVRHGRRLTAFNQETAEIRERNKNEALPFVQALFEKERLEAAASRIQSSHSTHSAELKARQENEDVLLQAAAKAQGPVGPPRAGFSRQVVDQLLAKLGKNPASNFERASLFNQIAGKIISGKDQTLFGANNQDFSVIFNKFLEGGDIGATRSKQLNDVIQQIQQVVSLSGKGKVGEGDLRKTFLKLSAVGEAGSFDVAVGGLDSQKYGSGLTSGDISTYQNDVGVTGVTSFGLRKARKAAHNQAISSGAAPGSVKLTGQTIGDLAHGLQDHRQTGDVLAFTSNARRTIQESQDAQSAAGVLTATQNQDGVSQLQLAVLAKEAFKKHGEDQILSLVPTLPADIVTRTAQERQQRRDASPADLRYLSGTELENHPKEIQRRAKEAQRQAEEQRKEQLRARFGDDAQEKVAELRRKQAEQPSAREAEEQRVKDAARLKRRRARAERRGVFRYDGETQNQAANAPDRALRNSHEEFLAQADANEAAERAAAIQEEQLRHERIRSNSVSPDARARSLRLRDLANHSTGGRLFDRVNEANSGQVENGLLDDIIRQKQAAKVTSLGGIDVVSKATQEEIFEKTRRQEIGRVQNDFINAQKRLLDALYPNISSFEKLRKANEAWADAATNGAKVAFDTHGKVLGLQSDVNKLGAGQTAPGISGFQRFLNYLSDRKEAFSNGVGGIGARLGAIPGVGTSGKGIRGAEDFLNTHFVGSRAQQGLLFGLPILSGQLDNFAGTAEAAHARGENGSFGETFATRKAGSGLLQGAVLGSILGGTVGSVIPGVGSVIGGAAGAVAGAGYGVYSALKEAEASIREVKIGKALTDFSTGLENVLHGDFLALGQANLLQGGQTTGIAGSSATALVALTSYQQQNTQRAARESTGFFGGFNLEQFIAARNRNFRQDLGGSLPNITDSLTRFAQDLGKGGVSRSLDELITTFREARGGLNNALLGIVADLRGISFAQIENEYRRTIAQAQRSESVRLAGQRTEAASAGNANSFSRLVAAVQSSAGSLSPLQARGAAINNLFTGGGSAIPLDLNVERLGQLGRHDSGSEQLLQTIANVGGSTGQDLASAGSSAVTLQRILPDVLSAVSSHFLGSETDVSSQVRNLLVERLGGADVVGRNQQLSNGLEVILFSLNDKLRNGLDGFFQALRVDSSKFSEELLSGLSGPVKEAGTAIGRLLNESGNRLISGLADISNKLNQYGETLDRIVAARVVTLRLEAEVTDQRGLATPGSALRGISVQQLQQAEQARQERLTGLSGEAANDPRRVGNELRTVSGRFLEAVGRRNEAAVTRGVQSQEFANTAQEVANLGRRANNLERALGNLADATSRNVVIQERLSQIQRERDTRLSYAERFVTGSDTERLEMNRGVALLLSAFRGGRGSLEGYTSDQQRLIVQTGRSLGNATLPALGNITGSNAINRLLANTPGLGQFIAGPASERHEERRLQDELISNGRTGEGAMREIASFQRDTIISQDRNLRETQTRFFSELRQLLLINSVSTLQNRQSVLANEQRTLRERQEAATTLAGVGLRTQPQVTAASRNVDLFRSFFEQRSVLSQSQQAIQDIDNVINPQRALSVLGTLPGSELLSGSRPSVAFTSRLDELLRTPGLGRLTNLQRDSITRRVGDTVATSGSARTNLLQGGQVAANQINALIRSVAETELNGGAAGTVAGEARRRSEEYATQLQRNTGLNAQALLNVPSSNGQSIISALTSLGTGTGLTDLPTNLARVNAEISAIAVQLANTRQQIAAGVQPQPRAAGGLITPLYRAEGGPVDWTPRGTDTIPVMASRGEVIMNPQASQRYMPLLTAMNRGGIVPIYAADGDEVNPWLIGGAGAGGAGAGIYATNRFAPNLSARAMANLLNPEARELYLLAIQHGYSPSDALARARAAAPGRTWGDTYQSARTHARNLLNVRDTLQPVRYLPQYQQAAYESARNVGMNHYEALAVAMAQVAPAVTPPPSSTSLGGWGGESTSPIVRNGGLGRGNLLGRISGNAQARTAFQDILTRGGSSEEALRAGARVLRLQSWTGPQAYTAPHPEGWNPSWTQRPVAGLRGLGQANLLAQAVTLGINAYAPESEFAQDVQFASNIANVGIATTSAALGASSVAAPILASAELVAFAGRRLSTEYHDYNVASRRINETISNVNQGWTQTAFEWAGNRDNAAGRGLARAGVYVGSTAANIATSIGGYAASLPVATVEGAAAIIDNAPRLWSGQTRDEREWASQSRTNELLVTQMERARVAVKNFRDARIAQGWTSLLELFNESHNALESSHYLAPVDRSPDSFVSEYREKVERKLFSTMSQIRADLFSSSANSELTEIFNTPEVRDRQEQFFATLSNDTHIFSPSNQELANQLENRSSYHELFSNIEVMRRLRRLYTESVSDFSYLDENAALAREEADPYLLQALNRADNIQNFVYSNNFNGVLSAVRNFRSQYSGRDATDTSTKFRWLFEESNPFFPLSALGYSNESLARQGLLIERDAMLDEVPVSDNRVIGKRAGVRASEINLIVDRGVNPDTMPPGWFQLISRFRPDYLTENPANVREREINHFDATYTPLTLPNGETRYVQRVLPSSGSDAYGGGGGRGAFGRSEGGVVGFAFGGEVGNSPIGFGSVVPNPNFFVPHSTDTIPAMLAAGSFVVNRDSAQANQHLLAPMFADGGAVPAMLTKGEVVLPPATARRHLSLLHEINDAHGPLRRHRGGPVYAVAGFEIPRLPDIIPAAALAPPADPHLRAVGIGDAAERAEHEWTTRLNAARVEAENAAIRRRQALSDPFSPAALLDVAASASEMYIQGVFRNDRVLRDLRRELAAIRPDDADWWRGHMRDNILPRRIREREAELRGANAAPAEVVGSNAQELRFFQGEHHSAVQTQRVLRGRNAFAHFGLRRADEDTQVNLRVSSIQHLQSERERTHQRDFVNASLRGDFAAALAAQRARTLGIAPLVPLPAPHFAAGGQVPGSGRGDTVNAWLEPGEFVFSRRAVGAIGAGNLSRANRYASGGIVAGYASGGDVSGGTLGLGQEAMAALKLFSTSTQAFAQSSSILTASLTAFGDHANALSKALGNFPSKITFSGSQNVTVTINGAEAIARITPALKEMVENNVSQQIQNLVKQYLPDLGSVETSSS